MSKYITGNLKKVFIKSFFNKIAYKILHKDLKIFSGLVQPLRHTNTKEMLEVAKQKGFDDLLYYTWTCWYPNDREPCGECHVCNERIIECKEI